MIHYRYQYINDDITDHTLKITSSDHQDIVSGLNLEQACKVCNLLNEMAIKLEEAIVGHKRYEKVRKFNVRQFSDVYELNIKHGLNFDKLIDDYMPVLK